MKNRILDASDPDPRNMPFSAGAEHPAPLIADLFVGRRFVVPHLALVG
jgi:hypothetical protein